MVSGVVAEYVFVLNEIQVKFPVSYGMTLDSLMKSHN